MTELSKLIQTVEAFENYLGSPANDQSLINFKSILADDEREQLSESHLAHIKTWGYLNYFIPKSLDGRLGSLQSIYLLTRVIARRDLTLAIALNLNFFSSLPIWLSADKQLKLKHTQLMQQGKMFAFALTESEHGSDLSSNEVFAESSDEGWLLTGQKWCINYATLGNTVTVLCRTHPKGGPLGFSLFYIDKEAIDSGFIPTEKLPTHGVRGLDISGFDLRGLKLPHDALIGAKGSGLSTGYKSLQVSRMLCSGLSLGGSDEALRQTIEFSVSRTLYGKTAFEIPVVRQRLCECFCFQLIQDCVALCVVRGATVAPNSLSIWSAIVKFFSPMLANMIIEQCSIVLGARGYLRSNQHAMFQKIRRDDQVIGLFDGSSEVNLYVLANNLISQSLLRSTGNSHQSNPASNIFKLNEEIPEFDGESLHLFSQEADCIITNLNEIKSSQLKPFIDRVLNKLSAFDKQMLKLKKEGGFDVKSLQAFRYAEQYCWLFAASCIIQILFYNQKSLAKPLQNIDWLELSMELIMNKLDGQPIHSSSERYEQVIESMLWFYEKKKMFSPLDISISN